MIKKILISFLFATSAFSDEYLGKVEKIFLQPVGQGDLTIRFLFVGNSNWFRINKASIGSEDMVKQAHAQLLTALTVGNKIWANTISTSFDVREIIIYNN